MWIPECNSPVACRYLCYIILNIVLTWKCFDSKSGESFHWSGVRVLTSIILFKTRWAYLFALYDDSSARHCTIIYDNWKTTALMAGIYIIIHFQLQSYSKWPTTYSWLELISRYGLSKNGLSNHMWINTGLFYYSHDN